MKDKRLKEMRNEEREKVKRKKFKGEIEEKYDGNDCTLTTRSLDVKNLEDALKISKVDLNVWVVDRHIVNAWEVTMGGKKTGTGQAETFTNYQVKVWLKRKTPEVSAVEELLSEIKKNSPIRTKYKKIKIPHSRKELEISIMDPHLGLRCYRPESDHSWSPEKCESMFLSMVDYLLKVAKAYGPFERIVWPFGNDFMHADNIFNTTTAGTGQPESEAWHRVFIKAEKLAITAAKKFLEVAPLKIVTIPGNHDRQSSFALGRVLQAYFHNNPNVEVDAEASPYKFHRYGVNLLGFEHGHSVGALRLAALMANECREVWADTLYREWHLGDQHRKGSSKPSMFEEQGVSIEYLPGLTPPNEWHRLKGFNWQKRAGMAFVWDKDLGPVSRLQVNINNYTGAFYGKNA